MNKHRFYQIVNEQGQHRLRTETFPEFEKRVMDLYKKRQKRAEPWRRDVNTAASRRNG